MKKIVMMIMAVALVALPTMAQNFSLEDQLQTQFQSTSTLQGSGSAYASQPALNADGTAYSPAAAPAKAGSGPKKLPGMPNNEDYQDNTPIGDAVLPLMLMALAFGGVIALRRRKLNAGK